MKIEQLLLKKHNSWRQFEKRSNFDHFCFGAKIQIDIMIYEIAHSIFLAEIPIEKLGHLNDL